VVQPLSKVIVNCLKLKNYNTTGCSASNFLELVETSETQKFIALAVAHNSMSIGCNLFKFSVVVLWTTKK
jgi:hypothetical protein